MDEEMSEPKPASEHVANVPEDENTEPWYRRYGFRKYVYGVAVAVLPIIGVKFGIDAATQQDWLNLALAVLALGGGGVAGVALDNIKR